MLKFKSSVKNSIVRFALSQTPLAFSSTKKLAMKAIKITYDPAYPEQSEPLCCISVDFDITKPDRVSASNKGVISLLKLAEKYNIPITWAVCGKTVQEYPDQYKSIIASPSLKEVAVHTYSHLDVSKCTKSELVEDYSRFKAVVGDEKYLTFIFPWNKVGHFDTLKKLGFISYRGKQRRIGAPISNDGLWNISPVIYIGQTTFNQSFFAPALLDLCVKTGSIFHLWTHPWDIVFPSPEAYSQKVLEPIFSQISNYEKSGLVRTTTMGELGEYMNRKIGISESVRGT